MNWNKLPKQKRDHLILVALITAVALGGLGFGLIRFQYDHLRRTRNQEQEALAKLKAMQQTIDHADTIETEYQTITKTLGTLEENMATGDPYSWAIDLIRRFRLSHKVEIPVISQPIVSETTLLPRFPYKQASFALSGTGYYQDIGRFIAEFENQYPEIRILNLRLAPVSAAQTAEEKEKLEFRMDIVALMRPNPA